MASAATSQHVHRVRVLYKTILRLHRGLPLELKALGDDYVKAEFRRHKNAEAVFVSPFMKEWAKYALDLAKQLRIKDQSKASFGAALDPDKLGSFNDEQLMQLYELYQETTKPRDPDNPLGYNPKASGNS